MRIILRIVANMLSLIHKIKQKYSNMENNHLHQEHLREHGENMHTKSARLIAGSIIAAALIIALSIFYNTKIFIKNMGELQSSGALQAGNLQQPQGNAQGQPTGPVEIKDRAEQPVLGKADAKVAIVEFSDFQCPYCQKFFKETFAQIKSQYIDTGKAKLVFRHFPLPFHANAQISGAAAECANRQGKFWEYHDLLFNNGQPDGANLAAADLKKYADRLGLNNSTLGFGKNKFNQCLDGNTTQEIVSSDLKAGQAAGVSGTPTFFINGKILVGAQPFSAFQQAIDAALK